MSPKQASYDCVVVRRGFSGLSAGLFLPPNNVIESQLPDSRQRAHLWRRRQRNEFIVTVIVSLPASLRSFSATVSQQLPEERL